MNLLNSAKQYLDGEKVKYAINGLHNSDILGMTNLRDAVFVATENQVFFYCKKIYGFETESIPFSSITSLELKKGFAGHKVKIVSTNNTVELIHIDLNEVNDFVSYVRGNIGGNIKKESQPTNMNGTSSVADEIFKLKSLLDMGVLTQKEFEKKKIQLLEQ